MSEIKLDRQASASQVESLEVILPTRDTEMRESPMIGASSDRERPLRVDWHSLLGELACDFDGDQTHFSEFGETKDYVLEGLELQIDRLLGLANKLRAANRFS